MSVIIIILRQAQYSTDEKFIRRAVAKGRRACGYASPERITEILNLVEELERIADDLSEIF